MGEGPADWIKFFKRPSTECLSLRSVFEDRRKGDASVDVSEYGGAKRVVAHEPGLHAMKYLITNLLKLTEATHVAQR